MTQMEMRAALTEAVTSVLEEAVFLLVEDTEAEFPGPGASYEASVTFESTQSGTCHVMIGQDAAMRMAAEMLGVEEGVEDAAASGRNVTAELANIITGRFLDLWLGEGAKYDLGTPTTRKGDSAEMAVAGLDESSRIVVQTDGESQVVCGVRLVP